MAWSLALLTAAIAYGYFQPMYTGVDDPLLSLIAKGDIVAAAPDPHLMFVNYTVGWSLSRLYLWLNFIPWYGLFMLAVQVASAAGVYYAVLLAARTRTQALLLVVVVVTVDINSFVYPQFTSVAIYAGAAGLMIWLAAILKGRSPNWWEILWSASLLLLCFLVRKRAGHLMACVGLPLVVWGMWSMWFAGERPFRWRAFFKLAAPLVAALLLSVAAQLIHNSSYAADASWAGIERYNDIRSYGLDGRRIEYREANQAAFEHVGWSRNDFDSYMNWMYFDRETFSQQKIDYLLQNAPPDWTADDFGFAFPDLIGNRRSVMNIFVAFMVFSFVPLSRRGSLAWCNAATVAMALLATVWLFNRLTWVIYWRMLAHISLVALLVAEEPFHIFQQLRGRIVQRASSGLLRLGRAVAAVTFGRTMWQVVLFSAVLVNAVERLSGLDGELVYYREVRREWLAQLKEIDPQPDQLFVAVRDSYPYDLIAPTDSLIEYHNLNLVSLEWPQLTPIHDARLASHGVTNLYEALGNDERLLVFSSDQHNDIIIRYVKEHFARELTATLVREIKLGEEFGPDARTYRLYRFEEAVNRSGN